MDASFVQVPDLSGVLIDLVEQELAAFGRETRLNEGLQFSLGLQEMGRQECMDPIQHALEPSLTMWSGSSRARAGGEARPTHR